MPSYKRLDGKFRLQAANVRQACTGAFDHVEVVALRVELEKDTRIAEPADTVTENAVETL